MRRVGHHTVFRCLTGWMCHTPAGRPCTTNSVRLVQSVHLIQSMSPVGRMGVGTFPFRWNQRSQVNGKGNQNQKRRQTNKIKVKNNYKSSDKLLALGTNIVKVPRGRLDHSLLVQS